MHQIDPQSPITRIGFIGLGVMGQPMVRNLLRAGYQVSIWARRPAATLELAAEGACVVKTVKDLANSVDCVISIVTNGQDVEQLVYGGLADGLAPSGLHVDMSTIPPATARRLGTFWGARGVGFVDAPVSGGAQGAIQGTLAIMAGGASHDINRLRPVFAALGKTLVHVGEQCGDGQVAKMCNQHIMVSAIQAVAEAMRLASAEGVDLAKIKQALAGGSAGSRVLDVMGERMVHRDFAAGIEARLHHKDFAIVLEEARAKGVAMPLGVQVWQQLNALMGQGWGKDDTSSLLRVLEQQ